MLIAATTQTGLLLLKGSFINDISYLIWAITAGNCKCS